MKNALLFILIIHFGWLKGLSSEPSLKSTYGQFSPDVSSLKAQYSGKKTSNHQTSRSTTDAPFEHGEVPLNTLQMQEMGNEVYDMLGEDPYFPDYDIYGDDPQQNFHPMNRFSENDHSDEPDARDMEDDNDLPDRKRENKKAVDRHAETSDENTAKPHLAKKAKHPLNKSGLRSVHRYGPDHHPKFQAKEGGPKSKGLKKQKHLQNKNFLEEKAKSKNQFRKKAYKGRPAYSKKNKKPWKERFSYSSKKYKNNRPVNKWPYSKEKLSNNAIKPHKNKGKSQKLKWDKTEDTNDFNNRLFKKSLNDPSPDGNTYFPSETAAPMIPELPSAVSRNSERNDEVKRQAEELDLPFTEEPPNDLKPGDFRAEMFHERIVRNGSAGNEEDIIHTNEKLPLEKRQVKKRRISKKDVNTSIPQSIPPTTTSTVSTPQYIPPTTTSTVSTPQYVPPTTTTAVYETTIIDDPNTVSETEPPITGEAEPPTTLMVKTRVNNKRFAIANNHARRQRKHINARFASKQYFPFKKRRLVKKDANALVPQYVPPTSTTFVYEATSLNHSTTAFESEPLITGENEPPTTVMVKKRADDMRFGFPKPEDMHLIKMIYRIKEQELESIFDTLNISTSTETRTGLTPPTLEDVVKQQSSMIKRLVKAIDEKQNRQTNTSNIHKKTRHMQHPSKNSRINVPGADYDSKVYSGTQKRFKIPGLESTVSSNSSGDNFQNALEQLNQLHKSKTNVGSSDNKRTQIPVSNKPATEIIIKNLLKNPAFLQQLLSKNSSNNVDKTDLISSNMLQLMATSLKDADKVEKNELIDKDKGTEEKAALKENQSMNGKLTRTLGDNSKATTAMNESLDDKLSKFLGDNSKVTTAGINEKSSQLGKNFPTTEGSTPKSENKKLVAEKIAKILNEILKNPSLVRRSNISRRRARDSMFKSKPLIGRSPNLTEPPTVYISTEGIDSEVWTGNEDSSFSDHNRDITTEEMVVEYEDETSSNSLVLTKSSRSATPGTEGSEDVYDDSSAQERDESDESEILSENDTTLPFHK